jgi:hypothetical protein
MANDIMGKTVKSGTNIKLRNVTRFKLPIESFDGFRSPTFQRRAKNSDIRRM